MRYYVIAGEASGDLHGSKLIRELKKADPAGSFRCWGGDKMEAEGGVVVKHFRDLAFMGIAEVLFNIRTILHNIEFCKKDILSHNPDVLILVDYPGFNMRIARFAHERGIKVVYYISPQVWAWKKRRVHKIHRDTDLAFVVLPFEKEFHARYGYHVEFAGHPLLDSIEDIPKSKGDFFKDHKIPADKPVIALLPGSRSQEIGRILPVMLKATSSFPEYTFVIAGAPSKDPGYYAQFLEGRDIPVIFGQTYALLSNSRAALVTSGTATLETALLKVPQVVCYRMNLFTALIAWMLLKIRFVSLVNLVLDRESVKELLQFDLNRKNLAEELLKIVNDTPERSRMLADYDELRARLGSSGASAKAASLIYNKFSTKPQ